MWKRAQTSCLSIEFATSYWLHTEVKAPVCLVAQLNEAVPCCVGSHYSVSKEIVTKNMQEEQKIVQEGWLSPASGSEKAREEQDKEWEF